GTLNTEEEKSFLDTIEQLTIRATETKDWDRKLNTELDTVYKTIQYKAVNVHDFAWAADKKFFVVKSQAIVGARNIDTYVYFHGKHAKEWVRAVEYINRAIRSYSEWVGPYPYPQATAVQSLQLSNGGMEYPMFTIISPSSDTVSLDMVITHEVGHNWFYGILGSNERDHAWMDEGLNSFYENRYRSKFHPEDKEEIFNNKWLTGGEAISLTDVLQTWLNNQGESLPIDTKAGDESSINYFLNAYQRPAAAMSLMENYLGRENFDTAMQRYFNTWRFRHPYPSDLQKVFEQNGKHNLNWFFDDWFQRNQSTNYRITEIKRSKDQSLTITLLNTEELKAPLNLSFYENGELSNNLLIPGFQGEIQQKLPDFKFDEVRLDPANYLPQKSRLSNNWKADKEGNWEQTKKLAWRFGTGLGSPHYKSVYLLPLVAYNKYDGVQVGVAMHNFDFPGRKFTYFLAPMVDFKSQTITGLAQANYTWFTNKKSNDFLEFDLTVRRFAFFVNEEFKYTLGYNRFSPKIAYNFRHSDNSVWRSSINYHPVIMIKNRISFVFIDSVLEAQDGGDEYSMIHRLYQTFERNSVVNPISIKFELEQQKRDQSAIAKQFYIKLNTTVESKYTYARKKNISMRLFAGFFIVNDQYGANNYNDAFVQGSYSIFSRGKDDYAFDRFYMGRSEAQGLLSAQINPDIQGGFHSAVSSSFSDGQSNRYMVSVNLKADLPQLPSYIPIKPFVDAAIIGVDMPNGDKQDFFWVAGVMVEVLDGFASVHIPILRSKQFEYLDSQTRGGNFLSNVSFRIALNKLNLIKLRRQIPHTVI
ncbi:MAG: M1 family aminopeptidase, partial [Saprospiraceae bacterium]